MFRTFISFIEVLGLALVISLLLSTNLPMTVLISLLILLISSFVLVTGKKVPRIRTRGKGLAIACVSLFGLIFSMSVLYDQKEERLAELRSTDTEAYLQELKGFSERRWLKELEKLRPDEFESEMARRDKEAEAAKLQVCTKRELGLAFVMVQADVRNQLHAPATARFPSRYARGTKYEGDCIYRIISHVDAENRFGALLRANFEARTMYFPDAGSWRTIELKIDR